jgi:hypothetical protein
LLCAAAGAVFGSENLPPPADLLPHTAIASSDNAFEISAVPARLGLRGPVLFFAGQFRKEFLRATRLEFGRIEHPITIRLGNGTNDLRAIGSVAPGVTGGEREWIEIPDPDHVDLDGLRAVLAQALAREWRRAQPAGPEHQPPQEPPVWLLAGVARHIGAGHRVEDLDDVHAQWQRGRLPPLAELLYAEPPAALQYPALQAVLAAWLLDHADEPFVTLLRRLANGTPWSPALVAETAHQQGNIAELSEDWDAWQANAMREIRQVGVTTPGMVRALRSQLLVYPGDCGLPVADAWRGCTFEECLAWPATPEVKSALRNKAVEIRVFAAGRDGALQRVAAAYAAFLDALAAGEAPDRLRRMLAQAEEGRRQLEERVAKGEVLRDPVVETKRQP